MTSCDRDLANAVRFGYSSGTSIGKSALTNLWMGFNNMPDPGEDDPRCPNCKSKSK